MRAAFRLSLLLSLGLAFAAGCSSSSGGGGNGGGGSTVTPTITLSPNATVDIDQGQTLHVTATVANDVNAAGVTWSLTGGAGTLSGNTNSAVTYNAPTTVSITTTIGVVATSIANSNAFMQEGVHVNPAMTVTSSPLTLTAATINTTYSIGVHDAINIHNGSGTLSYSIGSGTLPTGLSLSASTGIISGTPTVAATSTFTVTVTDSSAAGPQSITSPTLTLVVNPASLPPSITTTSLPSGVAGIAYSQTIHYNAGTQTGSPTFAITSGSLSGENLSLNASTGVISGTPTASGGTGNFSVTVTVGGVTSAAQTLSIGVSSSTTPVVTASTLPGGSIGISYNQALACSNCNSNSGATWAVTPASGAGSLASVGLNFNISTGVISGTPTAAGSVNINVTVSYNSQTSTSQNFQFSIASGPSSLSINTNNGTSLTGEVNLPFGAVFTASGGTPPYTWSFTGTPPAGINTGLGNNTIFSSSVDGVLGGTPTATASGTPITVKVTDHASNTATKVFNITVNAATNRTGNNAELNGQYAFLLSGFDNTGAPLTRIGSFTANGSGAITGGSYDVNGSALSALSSGALTGGSYTVGSNGSGMLTTTSSGGSITYVIAVDKITSGIATSGYLTRWDPSGVTITGRFQLQTSANFNNASINGSYVIGLNGFQGGSSATSLNRSAAIGLFQMDGAGNVNTAGTEILASAVGSATPLSPTSGTYSTTGTSGRGTLTFSISMGSSSQAINMIYYVIDNTKLYMMTADPGNGNDLLVGQVVLQTGGPFSSSSLSGTTVFHSSGGVTSGASFSTVTQLGTATWASGAVTLSLDSNSAGTGDGVANGSTTGPWNPTVSAGTYTVASNGRVTLSGAGLGSTPAYFYLLGSNSGVSMDFSNGVNTGGIDPQTGTTLSGNFSGGTVDSLGQNTGYGTFNVTAALGTSPNGSITAGSQDQSQGGNLLPAQSLTGATYTGSSTGRTVISGGGGSGAPVVLYVIGNNKAYASDLSSGTPVLIEFTRQ